MNESTNEHRRVTPRLGLTVFRHPYIDRHGQRQYSANWYYRRMVNGKSANFPLGMALRSAYARAEEIEAFLCDPQNTLAAAEARFNPRKVAAQRENAHPTFQTVLDTYGGALGVIGRNGQSVSESTFKGYRSFLATFLRRLEAYRKGEKWVSFMGRSKVDFSPWFAERVDILDASAVTDFKLACLSEEEEDDDEEDSLRLRITADTTIRNVRGLFSEHAMRYYKQVGLVMPDLTGFMREPMFGAKKYFELLPPDVVSKVMMESLMLRVNDFPAYYAFLLTCHCGLRRTEASSFDKSWLREEDRPTLYVTARGKFNPKHGHGRKVFIEKWVFDILAERGSLNDSRALDRLADWVRSRIPQTATVNKPLHEMRKLWTSQKAKREGILAAAQQAGHRDPKITQTHYADSSLPERLLFYWTGKAS